MKKVFIGLLLMGTMAATHAEDLLDVYEQALENDPVFKAAYSTFRADTENIPIAQASLLPQLTASGQLGRFYQDANTNGIDSGVTYNSNVWTVSASQAIFNFQSWSQVQKAKASTKASHATFNDASQDLILRTARAYTDVLYAKDTILFAEAKKRSNKRQLDQAQQRFNVGVDTITSVYEAKAAYDLSIAELITAKNNQVNQNENLRKLTNHVYDYLSPLRNSQVPLIKPEPNDVNEWIDTSVRQNYKLFASKYALEAARDNIRIQQAGSWPTLALQGSGSQTHNSASNSFFVASKQTTASVALALNFPAYTGGLTQANTRQAQFQYETSSEQLEKTYRDIVVNSQIAFNTIIDGISKIKADQQTVISQKNSLDSTEAQYEVGTRTMVDVVNAQQRLYEGQKQLAADQYAYINAVLNLKYLAGTLNVTDLEEINSWLDTKRINSFPPQTLAAMHKLKHTQSMRQRRMQTKPAVQGKPKQYALNTH